MEIEVKKFAVLTAMIAATAGPVMSGPTDDYSTKEGCMRALSIAMLSVPSGDVPSNAEKLRLSKAPAAAKDYVDQVVQADKAIGEAQKRRADAILHICGSY